ncbi:hypothetical protein pb186bvf_010377 [Paramecium bursaria]
MDFNFILSDSERVLISAFLEGLLIEAKQPNTLKIMCKQIKQIEFRKTF